MPLVTGNQGVNIPFTGDADKLVAESKRATKALDEIKEHSRRMSQESIRHAKEMEGAAKQQTSSWTEFRSMYSTVLDVVRVGQAVWEATAGKYMDNAIAVGNMARNLGTSTEEASRLKEVADDLGVGMDTLKTSFKAAQKDGISPTTEGLAKLSDEYLKLQPGVERTQFLLDKFGKSGDQMAIIMEKGGDNIRSMSAAVDDNLIVTEEAYQKARRFNASMDNLNDTFTAFAYEAAPPLIDKTTDVINGFRVTAGAIDILKERGENLLTVSTKEFLAATDLAAAQIAQADAALLAADASEGAAGAFETQAEMEKRLEEEARLAEKAIKDMTDANKSYIGQIESISERHRSYEQSVKDIDAAFAAGKLTIDERKAKLDELAQKQRDATHDMMLNMLELQLSEGGFTAAEREALLQQGIAWGRYSETAVEEMREAQRQVDELTAKYRTIPAVVETHVNTYQNTYYGGSNMPSPYSHQAGGGFIVPAMGGNENWSLGGGHTASAGERVTVTPRNEDVIDYDKLAKKIGRSVAQAIMQTGA